MKIVKKITWLLLFVVLTTTAWPLSALTPDDSFYGNQWYLKRIGADKIWEKISASPEVVVAVIDSGVMIDHPDLKDNWWINSKEISNNGRDDDHNGYVDDWRGWDFVNNVNEPTPKFKPGFTEDGINHGTLVAGVLAAVGNNAQGVAGVTWQTKIMALKALDDQGRSDSAKVARAIDYAVANGAKIINLSFTGATIGKNVETAIRRAYQAGVLVLAAGGNDLSKGSGQFLDKQPLYPVCFDGAKGENMVIGVAATGPLDKKTDFSGYGRCIDISAPGISIFGSAVYAPEKSTGGKDFNNYYDGYWSGTSLAVPLVSGTAALMMQTNPSLTRQEVVSLLLSSADFIDHLNPAQAGKLGAGRLNTEAAVNAASAAASRELSNIMLFNDDETKGLVKRVSPSGVVKNKFIAFEKTDNSLAVGDFNGDGRPEIAAAALAGRPEVRIFNSDGKLLKSWLAFEASFTGGVNLTAGDTNKDGRSEIIAAPASARRPEIRIFNYQGKLLKSWLAYSLTFSGGINLAAGDLGRDGTVEIVTAPAAKGGPHFRIFNGNGKLSGQFFADDKELRGGWRVAVASVFNSLRQDSWIVAAPVKNLSSYVQVFTPDGNLVRRFAPFGTAFTAGFNLAAADLNNDGRPEIIVGSGSDSAPQLLILKLDGQLIKAYYTAKKTLRFGVNVAAFPLR